MSARKLGSEQTFLLEWLVKKGGTYCPVEHEKWAWKRPSQIKTIASTLELLGLVAKGRDGQWNITDSGRKLIGNG